MPRQAAADFFPGSTDEFIAQVRAALVGTAKLLKEACEVQGQLLGAQIQKAVEASNAGADPRLAAFAEFEAFGEFEAKQDMYLERKTITSKVEAQLRDIAYLREKLEIQHHLPVEDKSEVVEHLDFDQQKLLSELELLQLPSPLSMLPDEVLDAFIELRCMNGAIRAEGWEDGFTPMHWAAYHGRRDLAQYLVGHLGGQAYLDARDNLGRTPVFYAQIANREPLASWLREAGAVEASLQSMAQRPSVAAYPPAYLRVLERVETSGWHTVSWKDGFTMLHWAADHGHSELCRYLVYFGANLDDRDKHGRTPEDCAKHAEKLDTMQVLQELSITKNSLKVPKASHTVVRASRKSYNHHGSIASQRSSVGSAFLESYAGGTEGLLVEGIDEAAEEAYGIPEPYIKVMEQIDQRGWSRMNWAKGFTLLHWAAKNNRPELCGRFLNQGADPREKDDAGKDALDYAKASNSIAALEVLESGSSSEMQPLSAFKVAPRTTGSFMVSATARESIVHEAPLLTPAQATGKASGKGAPSKGKGAPPAKGKGKEKGKDKGKGTGKSNAQELLPDESF